MSEFRIEHDSMGEVRLPANAYYGAHTQRAVDNFPISGRTLPKELIHALGLVKFAAAIINRDLGKLGQSGFSPGENGTVPYRLNEKQIEALLAACRELADGRFDDQFPIDVYQTGSGTSSNMNANEVIANRATELAGGDRIEPRKADPSQRPRQHGPKHKRYFSHRHSRGPGLGDSRGFGARSERLRLGIGRKIAAMAGDPQNRPHAPGRRHALEPGSGNRRIGPAVGAIGYPGGHGHRSPFGTARRRHGGGHGHEHPSRIRQPRERSPGRAGPASPLSRRSITSRPTPSATPWSNVTPN